MYYRIGELSKILHISDQMIRYYEKCGVIQPERTGEGNYRRYTDMDLFMLYDAIRYKELEINIASIADLVHDDYYKQLNDHLSVEEKNLEKDISYAQVKLNRIRYLRKQNLLSRANVGNFWMDLIPEHYLYYMGRSAGEEYGIAEMDSAMSSFVYQPENIIFFDPYVEYEKDSGIWWYAVSKENHDSLHVKDAGRYRYVKEEMCLCTVMDMGEPGTFTEENLSFIESWLENHQKKRTSSISGLLLGRGRENNHFSRMMKLSMQVKSL